MNGYLLASAILAVIVGVVHSVLGEKLIFRRLRDGAIIPTLGGTRLHERHVRILWASWHALSVMGWALAAILALLAFETRWSAMRQPMGGVIVAAMLISALLVFVGTQARHPGWIGLGLVGVLAWLGLT